MGNVLGSHRTSATIVSRGPAMLSGEGQGMGGCDQDSPMWEELHLELSQEDVSSHTELEQLLIQNLVGRHQAYTTHALH